MSGLVIGSAGGRKGVTSVGLSVPNMLAVAGSPITDSGTLAVTLANQNANLVFAGPSSGGAAAPAFRALVDADGSAVWVSLAPSSATRNVITLTDSGTNATVNVITLDHDSSGTPAAGFGGGILFRGKSSTTSNRNMGRIRYEWTTATDASRVSQMVFSVYNIAAEVNALTLKIDGSVNAIGPFSSIQGADAFISGAAVRNTHGGTNAAIQIALGNDASSNAFAVIKYGSAHVTKPNLSEFSNSQDYPMAWVINGAEKMRLNSTGLGIGTTPSSKLDVAGDIEVGSTNWHYWGDPTTDGSYRQGRSGNDLVTQRRESGSWVTKQTIAA